MSLFQCEHCGCVENTALSMQGFKGVPERWFQWLGIEDRKGKMLCSACGPKIKSGGEASDFGKWHGVFERLFLPMGEFRTDDEGNLEHIKSGSKSYREYSIKGNPSLQ